MKLKITVLHGVLVLGILGTAMAADLSSAGDEDKKTIGPKRYIFDEFPSPSNRYWTTESGILYVLDRIQAAGFNVYVPALWHGRGARYSSSGKIVREKDFRNLMQIKGSEPLHYLIEQAHERGIDVHAWFCVTLRDEPLNGLRDFYDSKKTPARAFDVHRPEFRKYILDVMLSIVKKYNIDGFVLDIIRTQGICTCATCQGLYKEVFQVNLSRDAKNWRINPFARNRLAQWQFQDVTNIVKEFSLRAREIKPELKISACGHPDFERGDLHYQGRDTIDWYNKGFLDFIFAMDYKRSLNHAGYSKVLRDIKNPSGLVLLVGNYEKTKKGYNNHLDSIVPRQPEIVRKNVFEGMSYPSNAIGVYWYHSLSDRQVSSLSSLFYEKTKMKKNN